MLSQLAMKELAVQVKSENLIALHIPNLLFFAFIWGIHCVERNSLREEV